jgi:tetratricopeptide (TPR) repeat protein
VNSRSSSIDPEAFVRAVQPVLAQQDLHALLEFLKQRWTSEQIISLLKSECCDARKVAALCLSLVGCDRCLEELARQLKDPDPMVNQMAEHAMWSIWFRGGSPDANHQLTRGALALNRGDYEHAIKHFNKAIELCPEFAEAFNQKALAEFLLERYQQSIQTCGSAVRLMPIHFGAWAGMGHSHAHLGQLDEAVKCYEKALEINPHLQEIQCAVTELRRRLQHQDQ